MPIKDKEKRRAYDRERKRRKRAKEREAEIAEQHARGNINYGPRTKAEQFMTFEEFKRHFPNASFRQYLDEKIKFQKEHRVHSVPKIPKSRAFKIEGVDLWHGHERKQDEIQEHHRQADRLEELLNEPEHSTEPKPRYDWEQDLEEQIEKLEPKKKSEKDEKSED